MVRQAMYDAYKDEAYTRGFRVYTTLSKAHQDAAYRAVRQGVLDYDKRHGYRGAEGYFDLPKEEVGEEALEDALQEELESDDIYPALVLEADAKAVKVYRKGGETLTITGEGLKFASTMIGNKRPGQDAATPRRADPGPDGREGRLADRAAAAGRSGAGFRGHRRRRHPRAGRAASTSTATNTTMSPRRGASRARASSHSSIRRRWRRVSRRPPSSTMRR